MAKARNLREEIMRFYTINRFDGGLNNRFASHMLKDNQASSIIDFDLTTRGSLKTRDGYSKLNASCIPSAATSAAYKPIRGLYRHYDVDGTARWYAACSGRIHRSAGTHLSAVNSSAWTVNSWFDFESYKGQLFIYNDVDTSKRHTPSAGVAKVSAWNPATLGALTCVRLWQDMLWVVPNSDQSKLHHPSAAGCTLDASYLADDYLYVGRKDGGNIKRMEVLHGNLVVLKDTGIYVLTGTHPDNYQLDRMTKHGCTAKRSVVVGDKGIIYLAPDGVRIFDGMNSELLSETDDYWVDIIGAMNSTNVVNATATYFKRKYILAFDDSSTTTNYNNRAFVYNFLIRPYGAWTKYRLPANAFAVTKGTGEAHDLYFGSAVSGFVYKMFDGATDAGTAVAPSFQSKAFDLSDQYHDRSFEDKQFRKVLVQGELEANEIFFTAKVDEGIGLTESFTHKYDRSGGFILGVDRLGTGRLVAPEPRFSTEHNLATRASGKNISIEIKATAGSHKTQIKSLAIGFRDKRVRG